MPWPGRETKLCRRKLKWMLALELHSRNKSLLLGINSLKKWDNQEKHHWMVIRVTWCRTVSLSHLLASLLEEHLWLHKRGVRLIYVSVHTHVPSPTASPWTRSRGGRVPSSRMVFLGHTNTPTHTLKCTNKQSLQKTPGMRSDEVGATSTRVHPGPLRLLWKCRHCLWSHVARASLCAALWVH